MLLKSPTFEKAAAEADHRIWLLFGPDQGRVSHLALAIQRRYVGSGLDAVTLDASKVIQHPAILMDHLGGAGLFAKATAVRIRQADDKLAKALEGIADSIEGERLIIEAGELSGASKLRKALEGRADTAAMPCWEPDASELAKIADQRLKKLGVAFENGVPQELARLSPPDTGAIIMECEKLAVYAMGAKVTLEDLKIACADGAESSLDKPALAIANGRPEEAIASFNRLLVAGEAAIGVLRAIIRHLQRLHTARVVADGGKDLGSAMATLKPPVFWKIKAEFEAQARRWTARNLEAVIARLVEAERLAKLGLTEDAVIGQAILDAAIKAKGMK